MRVLVTGASGLLGTWLLRTVPAGIEVVAAVHRRDVDAAEVVRVDLRQRQSTREIISALAPDLVLHAAYGRDRSSIVEASHNVALAAQQVGARLVMLSTEAVFAGDGRPRSEDHTPDPVWDYGRWKLEAERATTQHDPTAAVVRLPLLVSLDPPDGTTARVEAAIADQTPLGWYVAERRQPAYTEQVAATLWRLAQLPADRARGPWHLPGPERLTRRELGARIAAALGADDPGLEVAAPPADQRPHDLYLTGARAQHQLSWCPNPVLSAGQ